MSSKYKPGDDAIPHFVTFTVVGSLGIINIAVGLITIPINMGC